MSDDPDYERQPAPLPADDPVSSHDLVIADLQAWSNYDLAGWAQSELTERKRYGLKKYGQVLHEANGRDHVRDALDEALDLSVYLRTWFDRVGDRDPAASKMISQLYQDVLWTLTVLALHHHEGTVMSQLAKLSYPPQPIEQVGRKNLSEADDGKGSRWPGESVFFCFGKQHDEQMCIRTLDATGWCPRHGQRELP